MSRASMKEAMKNYKRLSSANEINSEAAMNLVKEILTETHDEYLNALIDIHRLNKAKRHRVLTKQERKDLIEAKANKIADEEFYLSETFQIYTLNNGYRGRVVINKIKAEAKELYTAFDRDKNKKRNI